MSIIIDAKGNTMSIPRITLRTPPFTMHIRLAVDLPFQLPKPPGKKRPPSEKYDDQNLAVQKGTQTITFTPGIFYIFSSIAGRRIVEPIRWVLFDSLRDILEGRLRTEHPERQDILAATFGEMLGSLILALRLSGKVDIVRIIEGSDFQSPDFILLEHTSSGTIAHFLECKGSVQDVKNINASGKLDLCRHIRSFRNDAEAQINDIVNNPKHFNSLKIGSSIKVGKKIARNGLLYHTATKNVSVVSIPDGRIPSDIGMIGYPNRTHCNPKKMTCLHCLQSSIDPNQVNAIIVFYQESLFAKRTLKRTLQKFIDTYRSAQRGEWNRDGQLYTRAISDLVGSLPGIAQEDTSPDLPDNNSQILRAQIQDLQQTVALLTVALVEQGIDQDIVEPELPVERVIEYVPLEAMERVGQILGQVRNRQPRRRSVQRFDLETFATRIRTQTLPPNTRILLEPQNFQQTQISASVESYPEAALIRLVAYDLTDTIDVTMRDFMSMLIDLLRGFSNPINWQEEFAMLSENAKSKITVGYSWDEYPYPHEQLKRPGITAWLSTEGRGEIIVRFPRAE